MPWSGSRQTCVAHSACDWTIGQSRRGSRSLRRVWSRIESSTAPKTSFWRWSKAPLPIRTGRAPGVAGEVVARRLGQVAPAVDPVHDLERAVLVRLDVGDELHELVGLPVEVEPVQRLQREGRVAHPRVAVVPVALAARRLGQRGRQRRHRRAGRHVRQALDRERRALDRVAPAVVGDAGAPEPGAPEARRGGDPRLGLVDVLRRGEALGPGEGAVRALARRRARAAPRTRLPSMPSARSDRRRIVWPAPVASAAWRLPSTSVHSAGVAAVVERPARRRARPRRGPRGTRPCAPACGRRRRRPAAACAA